MSFQYPDPLPGTTYEYRLDMVLLGMHGPKMAAKKLRGFAGQDFATVVFLPEYTQSLKDSAARFEAMAAMIVE